MIHVLDQSQEAIEALEDVQVFLEHTMLHVC